MYDHIGYVAYMFFGMHVWVPSTVSRHQGAPCLTHPLGQSWLSQNLCLPYERWTIVGRQVSEVAITKATAHFDVCCAAPGKLPRRAPESLEQIASGLQTLFGRDLLALCDRISVHFVTDELAEPVSCPTTWNMLLHNLEYVHTTLTSESHRIYVQHRFQPAYIRA